MKKIIMILIIYIIPIINVTGQGLNNEYPIDSVDIENSFKLLGLEIFKFPLEVTKKEYYVNYIIEEYKNNVKTKTINFIETLKENNLPNDILKTLMVKIKTEDKWFRIYWFDKKEDNTKLQIQIGDFGKFNLTFETDKTYNFDYRAFNYKQPKINIKTPLVVRYAKKSTKQIQHCPGDASVEDISKIYSHIIVVYMVLKEF